MPPALWPENEDAFDLWKEVKTQWRAAGFGLIGLDYPAVESEAEKMGIDYGLCVRKKIKALERWYLERSRKGQDDDSR